MVILYCGKLILNTWQFEKIWRLNFETYIKYETYEGSPSFVENNYLDAHISSIKLL
jgi:hypothetical protein